MVKEQRFEFGKNWRQFLKVVDDERIDAAAKSLCQMLACDDLQGKSFLDVGCGSGLFSLAGRKLGAFVHSFDVDEQCVACANELKRRYFPDDTDWQIETGSILDDAFLASLGTYDVVYCWGVLHHTGAMWDAMDRVGGLVMDQGQLSISIYNDQGGASRRWRTVKRLYNASPEPIRFLLVLLVAVLHESRSAFIRATRFQNPLPFGAWARKKNERGMSQWHDIVDWVGGYPFEVARPEAVFNFCTSKGFWLTYLTTQGCGYGCNEFTFVKRNVS